MGTKVSELTEITSASDTAEIHVVEAGNSKKIKKSNLIPAFPSPVIPSDKIVHIRDEKTSGTAGGTFTSGAWRTRDLNTVVSDPGSHASLATNQITLGAGTWFAQAFCPGYGIQANKAKIVNITDTIDISTGTGNYFAYSGFSVVFGVFTIASSKIIEIQHSCSLTYATTGFGYPASMDTEVYTEVVLIKLD